MITPKPADPRETITSWILAMMPPKNGTSGPNKAETSTEIARTAARTSTASHSCFVNFLKNLFMMAPYLITLAKKGDS
jgi:hypothetical protein